MEYQILYHSVLLNITLLFRKLPECLRCFSQNLYRLLSTSIYVLYISWSGTKSIKNAILVPIISPGLSKFSKLLYI